ncbi:YqcI/YcgG family protein [Bordetella bronchialis]|uniref:YqcI/YcgG family protein n=1 Tax=Bordetella bronchialis TaxID=463025 RepID=UPI003D008FC0
MKDYLSRTQIHQRYPDGTWQAVLFQELASTLNSDTPAFPCIFGVAGYRADQLRYLFLDDDDAEALARNLRAYVAEARACGPNTSLIVFFRPRPLLPLEAYRAKFWALLGQLAALDDAEWPADIPAELDSPHWEFCFAGEPIFVVCNTPAHIQRQSRRSSSFMMTFQPRWVFDNILGTKRARDASVAKVRERLATYDMIPASQDLGAYGDPSNREYKQYFLNDDNRSVTGCPFHAMRALASETEA